MSAACIERKKVWTELPQKPSFIFASLFNPVVFSPMGRVRT